MTQITSRWLDWEPSDQTKGFVSFVSSPSIHIQREEEDNSLNHTVPSTLDIHSQQTDKTDKLAPSGGVEEQIVSFVSSSPERIRPELALDVERELEDDKPHESVQHEGGISLTGWDAETAALIAWFRAGTPPSEPFVLRRNSMGHPFVTVLNPARYWQAVGADIEAGPEGPRARYGALQGDLSRLHQLFGPAGHGN